MKIDNVEVRSCPYCGSEDLKVYHLLGYWVGCRGCLAQGPETDNAVEAVIKWNSVYPADYTEYFEKMKAYCQSLMDNLFTIHTGGEEK